MANIHPFFSGIDIDGAANWTVEFLDDNVVPTTTGLSPAPPIIISEGPPPFLIPILLLRSWLAITRRFDQFLRCRNFRAPILFEHLAPDRQSGRCRLLLV